MVFFKKEIRYRIEIHREVTKVKKFKRIYMSHNCDGPSASLARENFELFHLCGLDVDTNLKFAVVRDNGGVIDILTTKVSEIMNGQSLTLQNGKTKAKLVITDIKVWNRPNFLKYLASGWKIQLSTAIDFSTARGNFADPEKNKENGIQADRLDKEFETVLD